ncbi:complex I subunit 5 family protein [Nesterenkonia aurantiaca]|uniref:Formate hydrogenlyase subunit 3/multisubunit Na+/H+ antiporter MnhD subunit n=1 Tax=Nesterenkonia aurantiaca TaxID=1436010 RepID=A0A4R7G853_9MICC|nr:complex I subunit 5 family protein [Nesterenkonia aurantiaca]TDS87802.1 formate hydrogenlyase subunit 3/multisubunit Na+/H+ antiporter MnhD subunit [Nesterenkonia aurantiaca]
MLIALSLLTPLALVLALGLAGLLRPLTKFTIRRRLTLFAPLAVVPAVLLALLGNPGSATAALEVPWMLFGAHFAVDLYARPLLLIAALLYGAALLAISWIKLRDAERGSSALSAFLLLSFTGNIGTYLAADAASFYLGFALMSFSAAGLVIHYRTPAARRATRVYLVMSVLSETAILAALILVASGGGFLLTDAPAAAGTAHTGLIQGLLFFGFGVKAGTVPLHVWLPLAHPAAPPAASAVLSGAMVKAGLIGWLRFLPEGETAGAVLLTLALIGAFAAVLVGVVQHDPKVILAYSTISQMGFITALVAVGLLVPELRGATSAAAVIYAVHHGLAKGALFLGVPVVKHYARGRTGILVLLGMLGAGLAVAGAPLTSGAFGKYVSKEAVSGIEVLGVGLDQLLPLVATGSTLLLLRFAAVISSADRDPRRRADGELLSWLGVCAAGIVVPWVIGARWITDPVQDEGVAVPSWDPGTLWDATWPILLGIILAAMVWVAARRGLLPGRLTSQEAPVVQPGDLLLAEESLLRRVGSGGGAALDAAHGFTGSAAGRWSDRWSAAAQRGRRGVSWAEARLGGWESTGLVLVVLLTGVVLATMLLLGGNS